jgi:hypothetical protein
VRRPDFASPVFLGIPLVIVRQGTSQSYATARKALDEAAGGLSVMRTIKMALDPHNLMNPGKMLPSE